MKIDEEREQKSDKGKFLKTLLSNKLAIFNGILILGSVVAIIFYNPYFVFFSSAHWIVFLSFIVIGAFISFYIYYKKIFTIYHNLFYVTTITALISIIVGNMIDSSMKDVTLSDTSYYKAAGSTKINIRGKIRNTGSMAVKRCELLVTARVGLAPEKQGKINPEQMFTPSIGIDLKIKTSLFDPDRYWKRTEKVIILDKFFPKKSTSFFSKQIDFEKNIPHPIVRYHLSCQ